MIDLWRHLPYSPHDGQAAIHAVDALRYAVDALRYAVAGLRRGVRMTVVKRV